ncbi:MAG TPA: ATP-binding cassette domain-containing protein, partial [Microbacterium sp.]|nr:ATP-binding cassette domain-containing protein [Microbacterium sp.]
MTEEKTLLSVRDLTISFGKGKKQREVVHGVSFDVYEGETVAIVGESGSGKSTTATAVIDLLPGTGQVTGGTVSLNGRELTGLKRSEMERLRGREIGYVPQD